MTKIETGKQLVLEEDKEEEAVKTINPDDHRHDRLPRMQCSICDKPNAVRYFIRKKLKSGEVVTKIVYEHRDEPPVGEFYFRGKKLFSYRRCQSGTVYDGLPFMEEHKRLMDVNKNVLRRNPKWIQCPECEHMGRVNHFHTRPGRPWDYYIEHPEEKTAGGFNKRHIFRGPESRLLIEGILKENGLKFED